MGQAEQAGYLNDNLFWEAFDQELNAVHSMAELLECFLNRLVRSLPIKRAVVFLLEPDSASYQAVRTSGVSLDVARIVRSDPDEKSARWLQYSSPVLDLRGIAGQDYPVDLPAEEVARLEALGTPLLVGLRFKGRLLGWLSSDVVVTKPSVTSEETHFLIALADRLAITIDNLQLEARMADLSREMAALVEIAKTMISTLDFERVLEFIAVKVLELLNAEAVLIFLSEEDDALALRTALGDIDAKMLCGVRIPFGQGIVGTVAQDGRPIITIEARGDPRFWQEPRPLQEWEPRSVICVRLQAWGHVVGVLEALRRKDNRVFDDRDLETLNYVADHAAIAINNARLYSITEQALAERVAENVRLREDLAQAVDERTEFVSLVTHELRVPLTSIKGYAKLLGLGTVGNISDSQKDFLQVITRNVDRMDRLVTTLWDLARLDAGRVKLSTQQLMINVAVQDVLRSYEPLVQAKKLQINTHLPPSTPPVFADRNRLEQILSNLVGNACRYTPEGGTITVQVCCPPLPADWPSKEITDRQWVEFRISDTGIGIADGDKPKIFNRFFRGDHSLVQEAGGTGFSLMVVKRLVELQGGHIGFSSELGQGSQFYFVVPIADMEASEMRGPVS